MGRKAGWLPYGVAIAGEGNLVVATEDVQGELRRRRPGPMKMETSTLGRARYRCPG